MTIIRLIKIKKGENSKLAGEFAFPVGYILELEESPLVSALLNFGDWIEMGCAPSLRRADELPELYSVLGFIWGGAVLVDERCLLKTVFGIPYIPEGWCPKNQ